MAKRRGVGGAIGAGLGAGLSSLGQHLQAVAEKKFENQLIMERQSALSEQNQKEQLLQKALEDPAFARRLHAAGLPKALGLNIPQPTEEDLQPPMMDLINTAQSPTDLPTDEQMAASDTLQGGQFSPTGGKEFTGDQVPVGIDTILARKRARDSKQQQFMDQPAEADYIHPVTGVMTKEHTTVGGRQGMAEPTERTTAQEAARQGAITAAETAARVANTPPTTDQGGALALFDAFRGLSERINVFEGIKQIQIGTQRRGKALINQDNEAQLFLQSRNGLGVMLAVLAQGSRPTDRDAKIFADLLPSFTTPKGVAGPLLTNVENMITSTPLPLSMEQILALPPGTPIPGMTPLGRARVIQQLQSTQPAPLNADELRERFRQEQGGGQ